MKNKINQPDQTSYWREKLRQMQDVSFNLFQFNGTYDDSWQEDFIQSILDQQEQRHQREVERVEKKIGNKWLDFLKSILYANGNILKASFVVEPEKYIVSIEDNIGDFSKTITLHQISQSINKQK